MVKSVSWRYAKVPLQVLTDKRVSHIAFRVYTFLAGCAFDSTRVTVGQRLVAEATGVSLGAVNSSMQELAKLGHIEAVSQGKGHRHVYNLKSPVFSSARARRYVSGLTKTQQAAKNWAETLDENVKPS